MINEDEICFYDSAFISCQGLTRDNILEYFRNSQFYERTCVNEILRMQTQYTELDINSRLRTTIGVYYVVEHEANNLFVIAKMKFDGKNTETKKIYYSIFGYIYAAPLVKNVLESHMIDGLWHLNNALNKYTEINKLVWLKKNDEKYDNSDELKRNLEILHDFGKK